MYIFKAWDTLSLSRVLNTVKAIYEEVARSITVIIINIQAKKKKRKKERRRRREIPINMFVNDFAKGITIDLCYDDLKVVKAVVAA